MDSGTASPMASRSEAVSVPSRRRASIAAVTRPSGTSLRRSIWLRRLVAVIDAAEIHRDLGLDHAALAGRAVADRRLGQQAGQQLVEVRHLVEIEIGQFLCSQARRFRPMRNASLGAREADVVGDLAGLAGA
jgi:hypothetical protein